MLAYVLPSQIMLMLTIAPNNAQTKKTLEGENRSATDKSAKMNVPRIKPN